MFRRLFPASLALSALLAVASPCLAAEGMSAGRAGIGGQVGISTFWADGDYSEGALARPAFSGHFRFLMTDNLRWQIAPGFTWSGYSSSVPMPVPDGNFPNDVTKGTNLVLLLPVSGQLQYLVNRGKWSYHLGFGPGVYRIWIQNRRQVLVDPVTFRKHRGFYAGFTGEIGVERFMKALPSTSLEFTVATHHVMATRDDQFPAGYNGTLRATEIRVGGNYYFDTSRLKPKKEDLPAARR